MVSGQSPTGNQSLPLNDLIMLVRVQATVRAYLERRRYRIQKLYSDTTSRYFKQEEAQETLTSQIFSHDTELQVREHVYQSGAVYTGQWKGGMRHG